MNPSSTLRARLAGWLFTAVTGLLLSGVSHAQLAIEPAGAAAIETPHSRLSASNRIIRQDRSH